MSAAGKRGQRPAIITAAILVVLLAAVFAGVRIFSTNAPTSTEAPTSTTPAPPPSSAAPSDAGQAPASSGPMDKATAAAQSTLATLSLEQKVGQVLMVSSPVTGADAATLNALDALQVGNVFLKGRSTAGVAGIGAEVAAVTGHMAQHGPEGVRPFVATDQEGGLVQVMRGPGFAEMPQAIEQAALGPSALAAAAAGWGAELAAVGINVNLAPVLDTVPSAAFAPQNAPIGTFGREYGYTPQDVSSLGLAFARGMMGAGVDPTVKHFPGLGRVTANTDDSSGVSDPATSRNDPFLAPFRDAVTAGVPWLMVSNAAYPALDATRLAPFSPVIVQDMVRGDLGFTGIIVSDDMCDAVQLDQVPVARRGVDFLAAGGTMALCTNQTLLPAMQDGMLAAAAADPGFAKKVDGAALLVLEAKARKGLLGPP